MNYTLVHNIIYGAIEFADDLGFKPTKDWKVSKYILEDDDNVAFEIVNFGKDGAPHFVPSPDDSESTIKRIQSQLDIALSQGNLLIPHLDYEDDDDSEMLAAGPEDETDEEMDELNYDDQDEYEEYADYDPAASHDMSYEAPHDNEKTLGIFVTETFALENITKVLSEGREPSVAQSFLLLMASYFATRTAELKDTKVDYEKTRQLGKDYVDADLVYSLNKDLDNAIYELERELLYKNTSMEEDRNTLAEVIENNPTDPTPFLTYYNVCYLQEPQEAQRIKNELLKLVPDFLYIKLLDDFLPRLSSLGTAEHLSHPYKSHYISEAFPEREKFTRDEFIIFQCLLTLHFLETGDLPTAIVCGALIYQFSNSNKFAKRTLSRLCYAIDHALSKKRA